MKPTNVTGYPFSNGDRLTAVSVNQICNALDAIQDYNDTIKEFEDLVEENTEELKQQISATTESTAAVVRSMDSVSLASDVQQGKNVIAQAIINKGGDAEPTDSFAQLAQDVEDIPNFSDMVKLASIIAGGNYNKNALQGHNENAKYGKTEIVDILGAFETINVEHCFQYWDLLERVDLPTLTTITNSVFNNCTALQEVDIPNLTTIGDSAFSGCSSLTEVNFPLLTSIGNAAFSGCSSLTEVNFPLLTSIGYAAFLDCTSLHEVNFPLATSIGDSNFRGCTSLQDVTIIGFTTMPRLMFSGCTSLRSVILPTVTTNTQTSYGVPFYNCNNLRNIELGTLVNFSTPFYSNQDNLRNITIGADTNINLPLQQWTATNVIAEGGGIDELNSNLYNNLLTKLYDHSNDGQTRTLRIGWLANVSAENIAYANAKGWTLTT